MAPSNPLRSLLDSVEVPRLRTRYAVPVLGAVILGPMLCLGGAWSPSVPVFAVLACVALAITGVDRDAIRRDPVVTLFTVLAAVSLVQLVPLPAVLLSLLDRASEEASRLAWNAWHIDRSSTWRPLHHDPGTGLSDFVYLLGLCAAYLASTQASRRDSLERVYGLCAASALLCAVIAFAHLSTGQELVYGFYRPTQAAPPILSPLLNPNHLSALTGAGAILWLGSALTAERALAKALHASAAVLCGAISALSLSRGGVACGVGGVVVLLALDARTLGDDRRPRKRPALQTWIGYGTAAAIFAGGAWVASSGLAHEYATGGSGKLAIFRQAMGLLRGHELLGYGSGAMAVVAATGDHLDPERTFLRVEALPIDLILSVGLVAGIVTLYLGARALRRSLPPAGAPPTALAAWAALLSLVAHDMVDFSLHLGGVGYFAAALGGVLSGWYARGWRRPLPRSTSLLRWPGMVVAVLAALMGLTAWRSPLEADRDQVERSLRASSTFFKSSEARAAVARHPSDAYMQLVLGSYAVGDGHPSALRFVARAMELSPGWAQPHLLLARVLAAGNRRSQALLEVTAVLQRSSTLAVPCARVVMRLPPPPTRDELDSAAPRNRVGVLFLHAIGVGPPSADYGAMVDALLLDRDARFVPALARRAIAARARGALDEAEVYCTRIERAESTAPSGSVCRAEVLIDRGDQEGALRVLERALSRVRDRYPIHESRARLYARRRDLGAMRRETAAMQETAGADLQRLIAAHGLRGELEAGAGNDRGAWAAYEMARSLAVPDQPYTLEMAVIASRLGDRPGLEAQCVILLEQPPVNPTALRLCDPVGARRSADAGAVAPAPTDGEPREASVESP